MFKSIVVADDGSEGARKALKLGCELQKLCDSELLILTVFRHHSLLEASMSMVRPEEPENLDDAMRQHATRVAEAAKEFAVEAGVDKARAFVKSGQPARIRDGPWGGPHHRRQPRPRRHGGLSAWQRIPQGHKPRKMHGHGCLAGMICRRAHPPCSRGLQHVEIRCLNLPHPGLTG
jgi:hypothetical protein